MKYYARPAEWITHQDQNGNIKKEVTKRISVLECTRNPDHCFPVDPAEKRYTE